MITITHEGSGPYIERTIIDYGGIRSHADLPAEDTLIDVVSDASGETMQDLRERIEELEERLEDEEKDHESRLEDLYEEIKSLTSDLEDANARLDSADPESVMRDEIARLKGLNEGYSATIHRQESELRAALHEARTLKADNASLKAGIVPKVKRVRATCACGGSIRNRRGDRPAACVVCGTPKGSTPDPETIAKVKASH